MDNLKVTYYPEFLNKNESQKIFEKLMSESHWVQGEIKIFGKKIKEPRKKIWFGEDHCQYKYSGTVHLPIKIPSYLRTLIQKVAEKTGFQGNCLLANYYANGKNYMGWHRDNEKEMYGHDIASISLGEKRKFVFRNKNTKEKKSFFLEDGSLLYMNHEIQKDWEHSLPKMLKVSEPRINLTIRKIL